MSIPLDRLYHYIESVANELRGDVIIYRFYPHGSKKLENLSPLYLVDWYKLTTSAPIVCHDQEPLDFDYYENYENKKNINLIKILKKHGLYKNENLRPYTIYDNPILVHSEKQSPEVDKYQSLGFIPVYYWSHAFIALDWFRFANHINQQKKTNKTFLIYNRAWEGTREYRIKFVDFICEYNLTNHCQTKFNCVGPEKKIHYTDYIFKNNKWSPKNNLENIFESNDEVSSMSADFNLRDYENTDIEIVLETLFDDPRIQLTEKTLRPIACDQPFVLVAPAGSLQYLRDYGFKTFGDVWDETYDQIIDPYKRLETVVTLMNQIIGWDSATRQQKLKQAQEIANFNKKYFFSDVFFKKINSELKTNLVQAMTELESANTCKTWLDRRKLLCQNLEIKNIITGKLKPCPDYDQMPPLLQETFFKKTELMKILHKVRKYYLHGSDSLDKINTPDTDK